jgi:hypothetical protein
LGLALSTRRTADCDRAAELGNARHCVRAKWEGALGAESWRRLAQVGTFQRLAEWRCSLANDWRVNQSAECLVVAAAKEMTMARVSAAQRKHIQQQKLKARHARMRQAKKTGKADIPMEVLQKLASLRLPNNPWVYQVCLDALLRGA